MAHSIVRTKNPGHSYKSDRRLASNRYRSTVFLAMTYAYFDEEKCEALLAKAEYTSKRSAWNLYDL